MLKVSCMVNRPGEQYSCDKVQEVIIMLAALSDCI